MIGNIPEDKPYPSITLAISLERIKVYGLPYITINKNELIICYLIILINYFSRGLSDLRYSLIHWLNEGGYFL